MIRPAADPSDKDFTVRPYVPGDAPALAWLLYESVRKAAGTAYTEAERAAWAPAPPKGRAWAARLAKATTLVAVDAADNPAGFMSLAPGETAQTGHVDLAYVRADLVGRGVGAALYRAVEDAARAAGYARLTTEASRLARPFFEARGWRTVAPQRVERNGVLLENFRMEKGLE